MKDVEVLEAVYSNRAFQYMPVYPSCLLLARKIRYMSRAETPPDVTRREMHEVMYKYAEAKKASLLGYSL